MKAEIEVLQPGLFSTIQDSGRKGFLKYGIPMSGVMDLYAAKMANLILRNPPDSAILEITQMGPKLKFSHPVKISICGALLSPKINNFPIENNKVYKIEAGDILSFGKRQMGCRAYLAISGGFKTEKVLKSRSWFEGVTDNFKLNKTLKIPYESSNESKIETNATIKFTLEYLMSSEIEVFPGPEFDLLTENERKLLRSSSFSIDKNNNRMAIQLQEILGNTLKPIITGPVLPGTVQLTPSGKLIVLMRDCQTTGGYPRVMQLSESGMNIIAQKIIGECISFTFIGE
jgi:biotin-dependent carboxylase-like uncharacterized protein